MSAVTQSIEVGVPIRTAYNQWTQFESFPLFLEAVRVVEQIDDTHSRWKAELGGVHVAFEAVVTEQQPDRRIAWKTLEGDVDHVGAVTFQRLEDNRTLVTLSVEWEPHGAAQQAAAVLSYDESQVRRDVQRFKQYIESRGVETGSWRGTVPASGRSGERTPG
jgi:uncharacterized membrane protein